MVDLNMRVFESFAFKDIIGETPLAGPEMEKKIETEVRSLVKNLTNKDKKDLEKTLAEQLKIKRELDRLSGAMALSQSKIRLFVEFITKYISEIESKINGAKS
ncbi:MAG TPA: hypothetical protein VLF17_06670 [Candidatus Nitrosotenuis sp.]|nr:hypothetical protein [Candidatus Nitrosotenuis sp.]